MSAGVAGKAALAGVLLLLLVGGVAAAPGSSTYPVSMTTTGTVTNAGNQNYHVQGGQLAFGTIEGYPLNPATTSVSYNLNARVAGLGTTGSATLQIRGTAGAPLTSTPAWTDSCSSASCGTLSTGPDNTQGNEGFGYHNGQGSQPSGCSTQSIDGALRCQAAFTPSSSGVVSVTAAYPGDGYNQPSSDTFTLFVGNTASSLATSTSLVCDQTYIAGSQATSCSATVNTADSSAETGGVTWTSSCQPASNCGAFTFGQARWDGHGGTSSQGCSNPDQRGQMQSQATFTPASGLNSPVVITATYAPASPDQHSSSADSYTVFVGGTGTSLATETSLVCDQDRVYPNQNANCTATIYTAGGDTSITVSAYLNMDNQTTAEFNLGPGGAGVGVPLGCGPATTPCNSFIPGFFAAAGDVQVNIGTGQGVSGGYGGYGGFGGQHYEQQSPGQSQAEMFFESPYLNPWGGPILITSADCFETGGASCTIALATTYQSGTIDWSGSQVAGEVQGMLGSGSGATPFTGALSLTTNEHENLVSGTTTDTGTMVFSDVQTSLSSTPLTLSGPYLGSSVIPSPTAPTGSPAYQACALENEIFGSTPMQAGFTTPCSNDCSALLGFPGAGVCTETGFQSTGHMNLATQSSSSSEGQPQAHFSLSGDYSTTWSVPALGFVSFVPSGTLAQR